MLVVRPLLQHVYLSQILYLAFSASDRKCSQTLERLD